MAEKVFTYSKLEKWLTLTWNLIIDIHISKNNIDRIKVDKYENESKIKEYGFFNNHFNQLKFILVIQLDKLLCENRNQKLNFRRFLGELKDWPWDEELTDYLSLDSPGTSKIKSKNEFASIAELIEELLIKHQEWISILHESRDKYYAHTDVEEDTKLLISDQLIELAELCAKVYNNISMAFGKGQTMFDWTQDWSIDPIFKNMAESRTKWLEELERKRHLGEG